MTPSLWVTLEKFGQQAIWLILFAILAPILGPKPYGLFAIVMVFIGFCEFVTVEAAAEALIGMEPLEPDHLRTATTLNVGVSIAAGVAVFLLAPVFGQVFDDAELAPLFQGLAVLPAISALRAAPTAILKRRMDFRPLAVRSIVSLAVGGVAGVVLALTGAGAWALVGQILLQRVVEVVIMWSSAGSSAGVGWSNRHFLDLRGYAANVFLSRSMMFLGGQLPRIIIGYGLGPVALGIFTLASRFPETLAQVVLAPRVIVARVELRQFRAGDEGLVRASRRMMRDIALIACPMSLGAAATIPVLFSVWLDARWQAGILASQLMLLTIPPLVVFYASTSILLALNFPADEAKTSAAQSVTNALFTLAGVPFGLDALCLLLTVRVFLLLPYPMFLLARTCGIPGRVIADAITLPFVMSLVMGGAVLWISPFLVTRFGGPMALAALCVAGIAVYALMVGVFARKDVHLIFSRQPQLP